MTPVESAGANTRVGWLADPELEFSALVIADEHTDDAIEVVRSWAVDAQDVALGQDTYCLSRNGATHYGGLLSHTLSETVLTLTLSVEAAGTLELPTTVSIDVGPNGAAIVAERLAGLLTPPS